MKRLLSAIIIAVFLAGTISGCGENNLKIDNTDAYVFNQDSQENFIRYGSQLYFAEGEKNILLSPASVDMGGVFITPLEKDFEKIEASHLEQILAEVCLDTKSMHAIIEKLK